jgi:hypothetical protein
MTFSCMKKCNDMFCETCYLFFSYAHVFELWGIHGNDLLLKSVTFCLAYFVAKKGQKMILSSLYLHLLCSFMYIMPVFSAVAFILQLFQVSVDVGTEATTS